ncbi:Bud neck protein 5 [Nakaseomyces bracarensis]|uniref:Bud neck protein 5 n=1 Tax=Nakaseomyces bracarensis TaxID=273131 RepID=A0ABR4NUM8_9SACH
MALDEETIKKRMSQIELDINQMNQMIDENLMDTEKVEVEQVERVDVKDVTHRALQEDDGIDFTTANDTPIGVNKPMTIPQLNKVDEEISRIEKDLEDRVDGLQISGCNNDDADDQPHEAAAKDSNDTQEELVVEEIHAKKEQEPVEEESATEELDNAEKEETKDVKHETVADAVEKVHDIVEPVHEAIETHEPVQETHESVQETHESVQETHESVQETHESVQETHESVQETHEPVQETHEPVQETHEPVQELAKHTPKIAEGATEDWEDVDEESESLVDTSAEFESNQQTASSVLAAEDIRAESGSGVGNVTPVTDQEEYTENIYIPKNNHGDNVNQKATRRTTNPFRVISVSSPNTSTNRKTSGFTTTRHVSHGAPGTQQDAELIQRYEQKHENLTRKCSKVQREIEYLEKMNSQGTLNIDDSRKLAKAIEKLQEYLDKKKKERYEVGLLLSRQLRRDINRGDNGEFWVGTK